MRHSHPAAARHLSTAFAVAAFCLAAGASAAQAGKAPVVLGVCEGKAGETKETKAATFGLAAESPIKIAYAVAAAGEAAAPKVMVRLQRKLPNGSFVTVKTLADLSDGGETEAKPFPAGDYRLEVTATQAEFKVTATKG